MERGGDAGKIGHEPAVILAEANKSTALAEILGNRPVSYCGNFFRVCADSSLADCVAKEGDLPTQHLTLRWLEFQLGLFQPLKQGFEPLKMALEVSAEDDNIVEVGQTDLKI